MNNNSVALLLVGFIILLFITVNWPGLVCFVITGGILWFFIANGLFTPKVTQQENSSNSYGKRTTNFKSKPKSGSSKNMKNQSKQQLPASPAAEETAVEHGDDIIDAEFTVIPSVSKSFKEPRIRSYGDSFVHD